MRLYIGVETKVREFDAKMLLACVAAEAGFEVILSQLKVFQRDLDTMPPGIFLDKNVTPDRLERYRHYQQLGFVIAAHDEEGLSPWSPDEYQLRHQFSDALLQPLHYFFAWGPWQADFVAERAPQSRHKILPVGHPRVDLTRPELRRFYENDVRQLRERYGRFILVNTNFSLFNHFHADEDRITTIIRAGKVRDAQLQAYYTRLRDHQKLLFQAFTEMMIHLHSHVPDATLILRPHPTENLDVWKRALPIGERLQVIQEGNILSWLLAAGVMIHNSCTTGIEAYLLERPVLSYRPVMDTACESVLPNELSEQMTTLEALETRVRDYLSAPAERDSDRIPDQLHKRAIIAQYITGQEGALASDRIMERLAQIQLPPQTFQMHGRRTYLRLKGLKRWLAQWKGRLSKITAPAAGTSAQYLQQKFPGIHQAELLDTIAQFHRLTGRFGSIGVTQLADTVFRISRT